MSKRTCSLEECDQPHKAYGWCQRHYLRWKKHGDPLAGGPQQTRISGGLHERFWARVSTGEGCWEWQAGTNPSGYGRLGRKDGSKLAHRISWEIHFGSIPDGMSVCHHCDNPPCVRPDHLYVGTPADNSADMVRRGRVKRQVGELSGRTDLTWPQVHEMRRLGAEGYTCAAIGERYGLDSAAVSRILTGQRWGPNPHPWRGGKRLDRETVNAIKRRAIETGNQSQTAREFGIHAATVSRIVRGVYEPAKSYDRGWLVRSGGGA